MKTLSQFALLACLAWAACPLSAAAGDLKLSIAGGKVTLIAQDVPLSQILTEWSRLGRTVFVNGDKLTGPAVTLQLVEVPEKQALDLLLRSASGYMAALRPAGTDGASLYDRVMILATSRPPAVSASAAPPPAFARPPVVQPQPVPVDDDEGEPTDQGAPQPGVAPPMTMPQPGMMPQPPQGAQPQYPGGTPQPPQQQVPATAPRPGMMPVPTPVTPGNPYQTFPPQTVVKKPGGEQ